MRKGFTPCINPLENRSNDDLEVERATQHLQYVFDDIVDSQRTNNMQALLSPCIFSLLKLHSAQLTDLQRFMRDDKQLLEVGKNSNIESHRRWFREKFTSGYLKITKNSIDLKIQSLLNSSSFANLVGGMSTVNIEQEIRKGSVIIANLNKARVGHQSATTRGRFLIANIMSSAFRINMNSNPKHRKKIYLIIDEANAIFSGSKTVTAILREARKA